MYKKIEPYVTAFKISWSRTVDYRVDFVFRFICSFLPTVAMIFLWKAVFGEKNQIENYDFGIMLSYIIISRFLYLVIVPNFFFEVSEEIQSGSLSNYIIKPINYIRFWFFKSSAAKVQNLLLGIIPMMIIGVLCKKYINISITFSNIVLFIASSLIAYILYFLLFMSVSLLSFWFLEMTSWFYTISFMIEFLSGALIPVNLLPNCIQNISNFLPFKYFVYFPISILQGSMKMQDTIFGILIQLIWLFILSILLQMIWNKGRKRYDAFGG